MVTTWVLIGFLTSGHGAGAFSQEFNSNDSCREAIAEIKSTFWLAGRDFLICVEK